MFSKTKPVPVPVTKARLRIDEYLREMHMYPRYMRDKATTLRAWARTKPENQIQCL